MNSTVQDTLHVDPVAQQDQNAISNLLNLFPAVNGWLVTLSVFVALLIAEQIRYKRRKQNIAGPSWTIPIMGAFIDSMYPKFEEYLAKWESGALSCVSVFHKFVVIASTKDLARRILNSPQYVQPCVVDAAKTILMKTNWVFLDGKAHVEYRKGLNTLFTRNSLASYVPEQMVIYDKYLKEFHTASAEKPIPFMNRFRDINVATSCRTFFGYYIRDDEIAQISEDYWYITAAMELVNFPIALPYTKVWYGIQARKTVMKAFEKASAQSRASMKAGNEPTCMTDQWIKAMLEAQKFAKEGGDTSEAPVLIREFSDSEIAQTMLSFLFASQDATSSAMSWMFQLLCDNPEVYQKVREEQLAVRNGDPYATVTLEMTDKMVYTKAMVRETLRFRPPVLMVPYQVRKDFPITPEYTCPAGAMIVPTFWHALHDETAYPEPSKWNPDRWITGEADKHPQNFLVFGTGPHYCLGQNYAILHLMLVAGVATMLYDIEHTITPLSEKIKIFATIFPMDDCILQFKKSKYNKE